MKLKVILLAAASFVCVQLTVAQVDKPVRIGIDGLSHDHIHGLLRKHNERTDISIVGIAESNPDLVEKYVKLYGLDRGIIFPDLETMIQKTGPEGVVAFNSIYDHLKTVEICAPHGVHVMVEKPLAVNSKHAARMALLAGKHRIHLLTNYETTWYPTHYKAYEMAVANPQIGEINKIVVHDGHKGPVEIGCSKEFLAWLTDPVLNGGGAVIDFGCYGANLTTWLMQNREPETVTAILQQIKPEVYPKVDDMATIILTYPDAQAILQGSWNWPVDRKDIDIYGKAGYIKALNDTRMEYRLNREVPREELKVTAFPIAVSEPFGYFGLVIRGDLQVQPTDLSSLENNLIVVKILDAARLSAKTGKTIRLKK
jgi:predicted dehydrogenase